MFSEHTIMDNHLDRRRKLFMEMDSLIKRIRELKKQCNQEAIDHSFYLKRCPRHLLGSFRRFLNYPIKNHYIKRSNNQLDLLWIYIEFTDRINLEQLQMKIREFGYDIEIGKAKRSIETLKLKDIKLIDSMYIC